MLFFYGATAMGRMASSKICTLAHIWIRICQEVKLMSMLEWVLIHGHWCLYRKKLKPRHRHTVGNLWQSRGRRGRLTSQRKRLRGRNQPASTVILDFWNIVIFLLLLWENVSLLSKPPSLWAFVREDPTNQHSWFVGILITGLFICCLHLVCDRDSSSVWSAR